MPDIQSFAAVRYDLAQVSIDKVTAPPYDVISPAERAALIAADPRNIVRVELPAEDEPGDKYENAGALFRSWIAEGVIRRDAGDAFYVYDQEFTSSRGERLTRRGFFALCRLEEFSRGNVLPHEKTLSGPKEDRLRLLRTVHANVSPIFALYRDPEDQVRALIERGAGHVEADFVDGAGVRHVVRQAAGGRVMDDVREALLHRPVYIADGHHRYETALVYRNEMREKFPDASPDAPWNFILMYLASMDDAGMEIQPTHRLLHSIDGFDRARLEQALEAQFHIERFAAFDAGLAALQRGGSEQMLFAFPNDSTCLLAGLRGTIDRAAAFGDGFPPVLFDVSVAILHRLVLRNILGISDEAQLRKLNLDYVHTVEEVRNAITPPSNVQCAVVLNPTTMAQLRASAEAGVPMPQKSTYFYPKLLTGLVINDQDAG